MTVSIHLMLLFIRSFAKKSGISQKFQYISCYSLSMIFQGITEDRKRFNTSHVTLYRKKTICAICVDLVSIHLMLLFIKTEVCCALPALPFQYISCYSLSAFIQFSGNHMSSFQYISCYSLSPFRRFVSSVQCAFQYISCYSLSLYFTAFLTPNIFIIPQNTMHCKIFTRRLDNSLFWD